MSKWYGIIGYVDKVEKEPGVWVEESLEKPYFGDVIKNSRLLQNSGDVNDNIGVSIQISIVADPYAINHIHTMRYAEYQGANWKVSTADPQYPRIILSLGGLYNGK
jgi:hypothetical protein